MVCVHINIFSLTNLTHNNDIHRHLIKKNFLEKKIGKNN